MKSTIASGAWPGTWPLLLLCRARSSIDTTDSALLRPNRFHSHKRPCSLPVLRFGEHLGPETGGERRRE